MSKKGLNITKRKDGRWEARVIYAYDENHRAKYQYLYGKTYAEAKAKKEKAQSEILLHKSYIPKNNLRLRDICVHFLMHKQTAVKESTLIHYKQLINTHIRELWDYRLVDLNSIIIDNYSKKLLSTGRKNGKGLSVKTVRDILGLLRSILRYAVSEKYIAAGILNFAMPRQPISKIAILEKSEQIALESFASSNTNSYKLGILLALYTGLRIGELCALKWTDIDFEQSELHINRTLQRISAGKNRKTEITITEPKTRTSIRTIPLPCFLKELLTAQKHKIRASDTYVLTGTNQYIEPSNYYMRYTRWLRKLKIKHYSFHALRHTFATRCVENGFDIKALSELLGHSDVKITLNRYVHPTMEMKVHYMATLFPLFTQSNDQSKTTNTYI